MPRKDAYHDTVKNMLVKDGWVITNDPYIVRRGRHSLFIDLAAEMPLTAEKAGRKIAIEIKSLSGTAEMPEFERALGQFLIYRSLLRRQASDCTLFLAVSLAAYTEHFDTIEGRDLIADDQIRLIVFRPETEEITQWIE